jgi:threonine/homoserine efflux transporter RhtA
MPERRVVIVGGGFAGLGCAVSLADHDDISVTLIDRNNYHQFQPLLYQVATSQLAPSDVAYSLRKLFHDDQNVAVKLAEVEAIDPATRTVTTTHGERITGDALVLAASGVYSLQIVLLERVARRLDPVALTFVEMLAACAAFSAIAAVRADFETPHGWTVWGALLVTGVFASALGFLVQSWAQRRTSATRTALAFAMEPVWTAFFGFTLAGDRLGALGWGGCALILAGIVIAEPTAARALQTNLLSSD